MLSGMCAKFQPHFNGEMILTLIQVVPRNGLKRKVPERATISDDHLSAGWINVFCTIDMVQSKDWYGTHVHHLLC